jgi:hypothetical protein
MGMTRLLRMIYGTILGALFGLAVGMWISVVVSLFILPNELVRDRLDTGVRIFVLIVGITTFLGLVGGFASKVSEHGLSIPKSTTIVATAGIMTAFITSEGKSDMFFLAPLAGVIVGGMVVVVVGIVKSNSIQRTKQENENTASKI